MKETDNRVEITEEVPRHLINFRSMGQMRSLKPFSWLKRKFFIYIIEKIAFMSTCPKCGKEVPEGAAFCPYCGTSLTAAPPSPQPPPVTAEVPISYHVQTATIPYVEKASRLELIVRILWYILTGLVSFVYTLIFGIIIAVYGIVAGILNIINFFVILITGKRWKTAFDWQAKLINKGATYYARLYNYGMRRAPYFGLMTDKRPALEMEPEPPKTPGGSPA